MAFEKAYHHNHSSYPFELIRHDKEQNIIDKAKEINKKIKEKQANSQSNISSEIKDEDDLYNETTLTEDVEFLGHLENPEAYLKRAYFTALTSKNEGFPNVLLESLVYSTPVVAYECESGPNEIIMDTHNGLLVKNQDIDAFAIAINKMITDKDLYVNCKLNAKSSVDKFNPEAIVNKWIKFLKIEQKSL